MIEREERGHRSFTFAAEPVEDDSLTWQARGLLLYLLSKPDYWRTDRNHLATQAPNGLATVRSILAELERAGYLTRTRMKGENGRWTWKNVIRERPVPISLRTIGGKPTDGATSISPGQTIGGFSTGGQPADIENLRGSTSPVEKETGDRPEVDRLCSLLAEKIIGNVGGRKKYEAKAQSKTWRDACRLLMDVDGKRPDQVERAIYYATGHEFWCSVVLSMPKLRAKYDQMSLQAAREQGNGASTFRPAPPPKPPEPHRDHEFGSPCPTRCKHRNCPMDCGRCLDAAASRPDLKVVGG